MKRLTIMVSATLLASLFGCAHMGGNGWTTLIDGASGLDNFNRVGDANWRAEGGAIVADSGKGGFLVSKKPYRDFQLRAEFWAEPTTNSGVYMRCANPAVITDKSCYEANIFDQRTDQTYATGGIVHLAPVIGSHKVAGKWNTYEITAKGQQLTVVLNGVQTATLQHSQLAEGPIALQYGAHPTANPAGAIKWRKVQIKEL